MKRKKPTAEFKFLMRWLASKGIEISSDEFAAVEGKFNRKDLPPEQQATVDKIIDVSLKHLDEFARVTRAAAKIKRQRLGR